MTISVNNQIQEVAESISLEALLQSFAGLSREGLAVAVNHKVVPRAGYTAYVLAPGDSILLIKATQGG